MKEHKTQICRILYAIALFVVIMGVVSFINSTLEMYDYYFMPEKENKDCFYQFRKIATVFSIVFAVFSAVYIIAFFARKAETKLVCSIWFWLKTVCMLGAVACVIIFEIWSGACYFARLVFLLDKVLKVIIDELCPIV